MYLVRARPRKSCRRVTSATVVALLAVARCSLLLQHLLAFSSRPAPPSYPRALPLLGSSFNIHPSPRVPPTLQAAARRLYASLVSRPCPPLARPVFHHCGFALLPRSLFLPESARFALRSLARSPPSPTLHLRSSPATCLRAAPAHPALPDSASQAQ